jgi:hypothetical protein
VSEPHVCLRCLALPPYLSGNPDAPGYWVGRDCQPRTPRKVDPRSWPNKPLCPSHWLGTECLACAALPLESELGGPRRPRPPRKIHPRATSGKPLCGEHWREDRDTRRQADSDKRSRQRAGVDEPTRQGVLAEQGHRCPCGAGLGGRRLNFNADHEHDLARQHDHSEDVACIECLAGFLCHHCNREIIGYLMRAGRTGNVSRSRGEVAGALEAIAAYLRYPPAARVRARRARLAAAP